MSLTIESNLNLKGFDQPESLLNLAELKVSDAALLRANYADASAADPKITALIRPADVQRSIDTDVNILKGGPRFYEVTAPVPMGALQYLDHDQVWYVRDDQPGLRSGRYLRVKGYDLRSGRPEVPVTILFWG